MTNRITKNEKFVRLENEKKKKNYLNLNYD